VKRWVGLGLIYASNKFLSPAQWLKHHKLSCGGGGGGGGAIVQHGYSTAPTPFLNDKNYFNMDNKFLKLQL
jgi:hypothetical protein